MRGDRHWRRLLRERVLVNLTDGDAITGVIVSADATLLELAGAKFHARGEPSAAPIDNEAIIPIARIAWIQRLAPMEV